MSFDDQPGCFMMLNVHAFVCDKFSRANVVSLLHTYAFIFKTNVIVPSEQFDLFYV